VSAGGTALAGGASRALSAPGVEAPRAGRRRSFALSIDTGGTFTDGFVSDGERTVQVKVDTTPHDLTVGFAECIEAAAAAVGEELGTFLSSLGRLHFSSTVATNTIVERRGSPVGLIVSAGAQSGLYGSAEQAAALGRFVAPELVRGISEQVDSGGDVLSGPDGAEIESAVRELLERGVRLLVLSFSNAHLNPANELRARALIDRSYPRHYLGAVPLLVASRVSLAADDFGRTATAVINAYLHPRLARTLYTAEDGVRDRGLIRPLLIVNTDGSTSRVAKTRAIDTYDSGPGAGVLGAGYVAAELGARHVCTFDVGGTTTDLALLSDARVPVQEVTEVGPLTIPHPSVTISSFGLGGGSVISADAGGDIAVGPESAGASPGPACYGLGGHELTPTDVWLLLGYLEPGEFLGGRRRLDPEAAGAAAERLAQALGVDIQRALLRARDAIHDELGRRLREWGRRHPALSASAPDDRWLFSYGGGGGLLCAAAAEILDLRRVVVFPHSSVFSAFGAGLLPLAHTYQSVVPAHADGEQVAEAVSRLADNARRDLRAEGVTDLAGVQAAVRVAEGEEVRGTLGSLLDDPRAAAGAAGAASTPRRCRVRVSVAHDPSVAMITAAVPGGAGRSAAREVRTAEGSLSVPTVGGLGTPDAQRTGGPAFLQAPDTTIFVPAGWSIEFSPQGYGILAREAGA
jgi:N-methylhydantoinase A/oxoprolinase/acetone carboxylase beta subunit